MDSLPLEAQEILIQEGFTEEDAFYSETTNQLGAARAVNMITLSGATKRVSGTMGHTTYVITSGKPILSSYTVANYGANSTGSSVTVYGRPGVFSGGIYISFTGASKYFPIKLTSQVTTTMGPTSVSCNAGGLTIGK